MKFGVGLEIGFYSYFLVFIKSFFYLFFVNQTNKWKNTQKIHHTFFSVSSTDLKKKIKIKNHRRTFLLNANQFSIEIKL